jgi:cytochrome P450
MALSSVYSAVAGNTELLKKAAGYGLVAYTIYSAALWIYNLYFHPLRRFPGPKLDAATQLVFNFHSLIGDTHTYTECLHTKYGEVVRVGPNQLSYINEQAWKDIYMHRQDGNGKAMKQLEKVTKRPEKVPSIVSATDEVHARQRKMLSHAFSDKALREQEPLLRSYTDLMVRNMHDDARNNRPVDMVRTFNFLTFDIIGDLAYAESFHATETRKEHPWFALFWKTVKRGTLFTMGITFPFAPIFLLPLAPILSKDAQQLFDYAKQKVRSRIASGDKERPDFMARVLKHNTSDGTGISIPEIESTFELLTIAGSETTATLMSGLMWLVHRNPEVLAKLKREVREGFASDDDITLIKIDQLPYLQATLTESLRMYPPVPIALNRRTPPEGISICGQWIPGGVAVGVPHRPAYLSPVNFAEPLTFAPERFIPEVRPAKFENDRRNVLQPFSAGPRNCLGKNLAYTEMKLAISRLMYNFDFEIVNPRKDWYQQQVWGLYEKKPLMLKVYERKR